MKVLPTSPDYEHLIHELQTLLHKEWADHIFTRVINNFRCPTEKLSHRNDLLIFSSEYISTQRNYFQSLFYGTTGEKS